MKNQDLCKVLQNKSLIRDFLSGLVADSQVHKSSEFIIPYLTIKNLAPKKSEVKSILTLLSGEGVVNIIGVASNISEKIFPTNFLDMELSHDLHASTIEAVKVKIDRSKIIKVLNAVEEALETKSTPVILNLSRRGRLYRFINNQEEFHSMMPRSLDYRIIEYFAKHRSEHLSAKELANILVIKKIDEDKKTLPEKRISDRIRAIKKIILKKFTGIDPDSFIPHANENNGYCLGKNIKIKISDS